MSLSGLISSDVSTNTTMIGVLLGAMLFGRASEALFRSICYVLIGLAALIGLPVFDGVLR